MLLMPRLFLRGLLGGFKHGGRSFCYMHTYIQEMQVEDMIEWQTGACGALLCPSPIPTNVKRTLDRATLGN